MTFNLKSFSPFCLLGTDRSVQNVLIIRKCPFCTFRILKRMSSLHFSILSYQLSCVYIGSYSCLKECTLLSIQCFSHLFPEHWIISDDMRKKEASSPMENSGGIQITIHSPVSGAEKAYNNPQGLSVYTRGVMKTVLRKDRLVSIDLCPSSMFSFAVCKWPIFFTTQYSEIWCGTNYYLKISKVN